MANTLGNHVVQLFAREALAYLRANKGFVRLVNRSIEGERNQAREKGQVVNIRRPNTFTAQQHVAGTGTTAQDLKTQNVAVTVDQHFEVKFASTDVERAFAGDRLVQEYVGPAVDAIAEKIESDMFSLAAKIGPVIDISGATAAEDMIVPVRKVLRSNRCPIDNNIYYAVDENMEATFLSDPIFHQAQIVGQGNQGALIEGALGKRFGVNIFTSQLAYRDVAQVTETGAAAAGGGDEVGAIDNAPDGYDVNVTSIVIDGLTNAETFKGGVDTFTIAGDSTVYILTADATVAGGEITASIFPGLQKPAADGAVVTFANRATAQDAAAGTREHLMFHRDAMALVMAPLPTDGDGAGAQIFTAIDEQTGLALRVRRYYAGDTAKLMVAVDALWGKQVLNGQMAVRALRTQP